MECVQHVLIQVELCEMLTAHRWVVWRSLSQH